MSQNVVFNRTGVCVGQEWKQYWLNSNGMWRQIQRTDFDVGLAKIFTLSFDETVCKGHRCLGIQSGKRYRIMVIEEE